MGAFAFADTAGDELEAPLRALSQRMARRGPDADGAWTDGRRCALAFRRLSILDLSPAGDQPMISADGRHALVFNGEIYNYAALRDQLEAEGHRPTSTGDAEVLLLALRAWGRGALPRLDGMFAFAFYDAHERTVLLARDHAGIKPLFYGRTSRGIVFASQYDQVLAHPWLRGVAPDPGGLGLYLRLGFLPTGHGLHAGTGQVEAGEWLVVTDGGDVRRGRHHELPVWQMPVLKGDDAVDALDDALAAAVRRHLVSDVPVGVLLSGGIDSPLVAAEARRQHRGRLQGFTIGVDDDAMDETADARRYAEELGLEHVVERITGDRVLGLLDDVIAACPDPTADYSMFPTLMVSRLARQHVKVVLSGDGGDELYWGYPSRFSSAIALAPYFGRSRPARLAAVAARRWLGRGAATRDVLRYDSVGRLYQRKHTLIAEADLDAVFPTLPAVPASLDVFTCTATEPDEVAQWVRWNEFHVHLARVLAKVDRASMHHSLEVRVPLLDKQVIAAAWQTDWRSCLDVATRRGKRPLREALARRVRHQTSTKKGFTVPMARWLDGPLRPLVDELLVDRGDLLGLPMRRGAVAGMANQLRAGDTSRAWGIWLLLSLALWDRTHGTTAA